MSLASAILSFSLIGQVTNLVSSEPPASVDALSARLLAARSATAVLEQLCAELHLADPPRVRALPDRHARRSADAEVRAALQIGPDEPVRYRRVRLRCGGRLLSRAENWYVPSRLTPDMNRALETSDTPFGTAIRPLQPTRRTLGVQWLPGATAFRHSALVLDGAGRPLAFVVESYPRSALVAPRGN